MRLRILQGHPCVSRHRHCCPNVTVDRVVWVPSCGGYVFLTRTNTHTLTQISPQVGFHNNESLTLLEIQVLLHRWVHIPSVLFIGYLKDKSQGIALSLSIP